MKNKVWTSLLLFGFILIVYYINLKVYSCKWNTDKECIIKYYESLWHKNNWYFFHEWDSWIWVWYSDYLLPFSKVLKYAKKNQYNIFH